jgi:hypothetical protein
MKKTVIAAALAAMTLPAAALDKMPDPGWSGFINLGVGTGSIESNFLARVSGVDVDLGDDTIQDFGAPDDESITLPAVNLSVGYTFSGGKTRIFLGNDLADFLQFDRTTLLALRHDFDMLGRFQVALLSSAFPSTEVWADPYVIGEKRKDTEFSSTGGRITWDKIFGTQFEIKVSSREREIDDEASGQWLVDRGELTTAEAKLLDREGDVMRAELGYLFNLGDGTHFIRPSVSFIDRDLDGDAMAQDGYEAAITYIYNTKSFRWVNNLLFQSLEGDKENPIFDEVNDEDVIGFSTQMFFPGAFGLEHWQPNISAIYADSDNDIDFNDSTGWLVQVGIARTF